MQKPGRSQPATLFTCGRSPALLSLPGRSCRLVLPTPRHFLESLKEIDKFALIKRPEDAAFTGTNKASAIRDKALHRVRDGFMFVPAGINAVVPGKTNHIRNTRHGRRAYHTLYNGTLYRCRFLM